MKRFSDKLDHIFWWLIWLLPIIGGFIVLATNGAHDFSVFMSFLNNFTFDFIADILVDMFGVASLQLPDVLLALMSYIVSVELCHVLVDVLVFIPRFCHKLVQLDSYVDIDDCSNIRKYRR